MRGERHRNDCSGCLWQAVAGGLIGRARIGVGEVVSPAELADLHLISGSRIIVWLWQRRMLPTTSFCGDYDLLPLAINVNDRKRPEGNQIDSGHEFGKECWQKFPVPPEQVNQNGCEGNVEHVISGRQSAFG